MLNIQDPYYQLNAEVRREKGEVSMTDGSIESYQLPGRSLRGPKWKIELIVGWGGTICFTNLWNTNWVFLALPEAALSVG